jgi:hypothetical protein
VKKPLTWIPWYVDSWIYGSSRLELTRAQRSDFLDLVLLAGKDDGYIRANATTPYPITQLAGLLCIEAKDLEETIEACIRAGKITRLENGTLYVTNWETFKLTPQYRRRIEKGHEEKKRILEKSKGEESKGKGTYGSKKGTSPPPTPDNQDKGTEEEGLLAIPEGLPFKAKDEIIERKAEISRISRLIEAGLTHEGPARLTREDLELRKQAFNDRVRDFS